MKNKKILAIILVIAAAITFSCEDFLSLNPISSYNAGSFYKTQKDFEMAVNGMYNEFQAMHAVVGTGNIVLNLESRSDNCTLQTGYDPGILHQFINNASTGSTKGFWGSFYTIVQQSNEILGKIDAGIFADETRRSNLKGEAYFFRGLAYFQLGYLFGGVPLIDHSMKVDEIKQIARSTQAETFSFAEADLVQAILLLPDSWVAKELGKATKYSAQGILARLYLFQKKYSDAKPLLQSIINSGKYTLATNFVDCFLDKYDNSTEHVFQVQCVTGSLGEGNGFVAMEAPLEIRSTEFPKGGSAYYNKASSDLYKSYETGDLRRNISLQKGWKNAAGQTDTITIFFVKYAHGTIPALTNDYAVNFPILRYTDVKLMYAEVLNEENYDPAGEAFSILNVVRARAGLKPLTSIEVPTQEAFRNAMLHERRAEFACEYLRWYDLLRTGKAVGVMNAFFAQPSEGSSKYKMEEYMSIFPIPEYELLLITDPKILWQNPGY
ncbi:MAG: RagB/SusD family nutrient uptake outer membrane protein [Bacteroidia bacterium]|nr:RagB/SusD family nutrient uptake outer membrane protein [Bacteroidia bacterium]